MKSLLIYHQIKEGIDCPDGIAAAWVVDRYLRSRGEFFRVLGCSYQSETPDVSEYDRVFVLDFSFPRSIVDSWVAEKTQVIIIDHHKTAKEMLGDISRFSERFEFNFDLNESGATLAWKYFRSEWATPAFLLYVRDRDLWNHLLPMTAEINEASSHMRFELGKVSKIVDIPARELIFSSFDHLATLTQEQLIEVMADRGFELLKPKREAIDRAVARMEYGFLPHTDRGQLSNTPIPMVYVLPDGSENRMMSDICAKLYKNIPEAPFVACVTADGGWSLRSDKDGGNFDVSAVAKFYGGGGHWNASGFKIGGSSDAT